MVIEIQNSPLSEAELISRENFYGKMMWIVNGENFKKNFSILGRLPDPKSEIAQRVRFTQPKLDSWYVRDRHKGENPQNEYEAMIPNWVDFHFRDENPDYEMMLNSKENASYIMIQEPLWDDHCKALKEIEENYIGHHIFIWKKR